MSELTKTRADWTNFRRQLLATASAVALVGLACDVTVSQAAASDSGHPTVWIELGGQLSRLDESQEVLAPDFPNSPSRPSIFSPSQTFERLPLYSIDETGKLSFEPNGSDWVFSASVRFGRSSSKKHVHQQTNPNPFVKYYYNSYGTAYIPTPHRHKVKHVNSPYNAKFADTDVRNGESHLILDFQAGKDIGLGMFGSKSGSSILNLGVRFAQFSSKSNVNIKSNPDWHFHYKYLPSLVGTRFPSSKFQFGSVFHSNAASLSGTRSFHGVGPSLSWNASLPVAGSIRQGELAFDWGISAAVLCGRQRTHTHHQTTGRYHGAKYAQGSRVITQPPTATPDHSRSRSVTVPNVGGFAGLTYRMNNFKMSAGYKADFFFGAMDGGIDAHQSKDIGFFGPFATVSIGLGG